MTRQASEWGLRLGVLAAALLVMGLLAAVMIPTRGPFSWDEAGHALKGLMFAQDLRQGDWLSFLYNSYRQVLYPPLHAWLLAGSYLIAGATPQSAIWVSLILFGLSAGTIYWAGRALTPDHSGLVGAAAALLWLGSPPLQRYAVQAMQEMAGMAALVLALGVTLWTLEQDRTGRATRWTWMGLGLAVALLYFTRTPYGIILGLALGVTLLARAGFNPIRLWRAEIGWFLLPLVLLLAIWFAYWPKFGATFQWLVNYPDGVDDPYSVEGWLYYPLAVVRNSGSPWLLAAYLAALVWAVVRRRTLAAGFLVVLVLIQFGIGMFHQNKQARYLFPMLPAFFLLAGMAVDAAWRWASGRGAVWRVAWAAGMIVAALHLVLLGRASIVPGPGPRPDPVTPYVAAQVAEGTSSLVIGSMEMDYPGASLLDWRLATEQGRLLPTHAGAAVQIEEGRRLAGLVARLPLPEGWAARLGRTFTAYDQPAPLRTLYVRLPLRATYSQGPGPYGQFVSDLIAAQGIDRVVVISRVYNASYPREMLAAPLVAASWTLVGEARFDESGTAVGVYTRP